MVDQPEKTSLRQAHSFAPPSPSSCSPWSAVGVWLFVTRGHESTDDAQVDAHVTQMAARVGGTVARIAVVDNQVVEAGDVLVEIDPRDYQVAVDKARAELADAEATLLAAKSNVPITSTDRVERRVDAPRARSIRRAAAPRRPKSRSMPRRPG